MFIPTLIITIMIIHILYINLMVICFLLLLLTLILNQIHKKLLSGHLFDKHSNHSVLATRTDTVTQNFWWESMNQRIYPQITNVTKNWCIFKFSNINSFNVAFSREIEELNYLGLDFLLLFSFSFIIFLL